MLTNKKIAYIFASIGETSFEISKKSFFKNFLDKFLTKNKKVKKDVTDIYEITDKFISSISRYSEKKCFSFYLNLENRHEKFINDINEYKADRYYIFPLYPQYNRDINSIANFFSLNFFDDIVERFFWTKSYSHHPLFITAHQKNIKSILKKNNLDEKKSSILFLAKKLNTHNPLYFFECETTSQNIIKTFPYIEGHLHYFSDDYKDLKIDEIRKNSIIIPISNLIDNSEIIKNIECLKTSLKNQKKDVFISKTLNYNNTFIRSVFDIIDDKNFISNEMLLSL